MEASQEVCVICLDNIKEAKISLEECHHTFCKACIDKWTDIRQKCPMCNVELTSLSSKKDAKSQDSDHADEQFECFDHSYFKNEFEKLQRKLDDTKFKAKKDHKLNLSNTWNILEMLGLEIGQKLKVLNGLEKFRPKDYLEDAMRIDEALKGIFNKNLNTQKFQSEFLQATTNYEVEDEDYYEDEEEEYYEDYYDYGYDEDEEEEYGYGQKDFSGNFNKRQSKPKFNKKTGQSALKIKC